MIAIDLERRVVTRWLLLGQIKVFGATCLTQYSHQNGQEQLWLDFQKASLKTPRFSAVFLYVVKAIDDRGTL